MIDLQLTQQELNTVLQGLYILEDQSWFFSKEKTDKLIEKLNLIDKAYQTKKDALCDI
jgi:hypothetical protein